MAAVELVVVWQGHSNPTTDTTEQLMYHAPVHALVLVVALVLTHIRLVAPAGSPDDGEGEQNGDQPLTGQQLVLAEAAAAEVEIVVGAGAAVLGT